MSLHLVTLCTVQRLRHACPCRLALKNQEQLAAEFSSLAVAQEAALLRLCQLHGRGSSDAVSALKVAVARTAQPRKAATSTENA